jgi:hypothetical protein
MSTPGFVPQDSDSLTAIRYYTPLDPYFYSVDNRPLTDLASNITTISEGGGDSARRAVLLTQCALSSVFQELFSTTNTAGFVSGLTMSYPAANTIQVNPGALYQTTVLNAVTSTPVIKQALLLAYQQFSIVQPTTSGQSISYLIEGQYQDLSSTNMATSPLPYLDSTNTFLPCVLLNGQLGLQMKTGASGPTGSQVIPTPDAGWVGLYVVTATYGQANPVITAYSAAPKFRGLRRPSVPVTLSSGGATNTNFFGCPAWQFPKSGTTGVSLPISLSPSTTLFDAGSFPNPYVPIKAMITFSSDVAGGNFALQLGYNAIAAGGSTTGSLTTTTLDAAPMTVAANSMTQFQTVNAVVPATVFSGLNSSNQWAVTDLKLFLTLSRLGGNAADTSTGNFFLHDVVLYQ